MWRELLISVSVSEFNLIIERPFMLQFITTIQEYIEEALISLICPHTPLKREVD